MKRCSIIVVLTLIAFSAVVAQEDQIPPPRRAHPQKVGALGGFTTGWLFLDAKPINSFLTGGKAGSVSEGGVFLMGGAGSAYIMVVRNFRVGGVGMSGSVSSSALDPATGVRRDAQLKAGYGALTFEYVVPLIERLDLIGGLAVGTGGIDIILRKSNGTQSTWNGEQASLGLTDISSTGNITRTLSGKFYVWIPSVNLEYAFLGWLGLRAGVSYVGMSGPSWKVDDNFDLLNVPSGVNGKGWMINLGVLVGTF
jgi:hypothetical protein